MSWSNIHGHDAARDQLRTAYRRGRLAHAYLFCGPSGVGKRRFALEFAKALLCEAPPDALTACDRCSACVQVVAGTHPDCAFVGKPDDKQELVIETIRDLIATLGLKPTRGVRKVAVIEDADDFNVSSANAFLKCLEEPPPGTTLVLLATAADSQLATIRSRCQVVPFPPLSDDALERVLADHGVRERAVVDRLLRLAGGSAEQALALNDPAVLDLRAALLAALGSPRPASAPLLEVWSKFIEDAGKDSAAQRRRASAALRLAVDLLATALRLALGRDALDLEAADADKLRRCADRIGVDGLMELLDRCVEADHFVDRRVQLVLLTEQLVEKFGRAVAPAVTDRR
jgi:DNA polymerase III subunit delta'